MTPRPLIVRLCNWIGDVVLSLPALKQLQDGGYTLQLYGKGWAPTVLSLPALQRLQDAGYALQLYGKGWAPTVLSGYDWPVTVRGKTLRDRVQQLKTLRTQCQALDAGFDARINALAMPNSFSSVLELRLAGLRAAGVARDGRGLLLGQRLHAKAAGPHALQHFCALADGLLGSTSTPPAAIAMQLSAAALQQARALVAERGWGSGSGYVCIAPFAAGTVHKLGLTVVVCPGPGETALAHSAYPGAQVVENLPLDAYAALLQGSRLVIANDTGPGHLAAATGAPLISVLGPTKVEQWRPWGTTITLLSDRPDWPSVPAVLAAVQARLAAGATASGAAH